MQHQAWMVQGEVALTDDEPAFNRVTPKHPFDGTWGSFSRGNWGAVAIGGRYSEQYLDPTTFGDQFGNSSLYARTANGYSATINWYANREFRMQAMWEHTDLKGANSTYTASGTSDFVIIRVTLLY